MSKFNIRASFKNKFVRYGGYATLFTVAVLAVLVVLNLIVQQIPAQFDLTQNKLFSLSEQTEDIVNSIEQPVTIYGLFSIGNEPAQLMEVIRRYENSSRFISFKLVDPDSNPGFAAKYAPKGDTLRAGSIVVESGKNFKALNYYDLLNISYQNPENPQVQSLAFEQRITNALLYVTTGETPKIYQIVGHEESSLAQAGVLKQVQNENFSVADLNLITEPTVPEDAAVLLVMSPKRDYTAAEAEKIRSYLNAGGKAMFLLDFMPGNEFPVLKDLLNSFGVSYNNKEVAMEGDPYHYFRNQSGSYNSWLIPVIQSQEITDPLAEDDLIVLLPLGVPLGTPELKKQTIEVEKLLTTTDNSWARTDYNNSSLERIPSDTKGPVTLAVAVKEQPREMDQKTFRIVAVGGSLFALPQRIFGEIPPGNIDFFMNSLAWTVNRTESISIRPKSLLVFPMQMNGMQILIFAGIFTILIPVIVLVFGLIVWLRRRHL